MAQGYNKAKADLVNQLVRDGISLDAALIQAGITGDDVGNYQIDDTIGGTGLVGELDAIGSRRSNPNPVKKTENPQVADTFFDVPPASSINTTTTTTTTTSGGGTKTIIAGVDKPTPESTALQTQADATQAQIKDISRQLGPAKFGGNPNLTADEKATLRAQQTDLYKQYNEQSSASAAAMSPGNPTTTTTPNTTTTATTTQFSTSSADRPVGANDTQLGQQQIYSTSAPPPANQIQTAATNPEVTVTPVDPVPLTQIKTDAGGVPVTTPTSGNAAALVDEGGLAPQQAVDTAFIQNNPIAPDPFAQENASPEPLARTITVPGDYSVVPNNNGSFDVVETQTGVTVASGLDRDEASVFAYEQSQIDTGVEIPNPDAAEVPNQLSGPTDVEDPLALYASQELDPTSSLAQAPAAPDPYSGKNGLPYDEESGLLNPGWSLREDGTPVFVGYDFVEPATQASGAESRKVAAALAETKRQQTLLDQQRTLNKADWRLRLSLADNSNYLYNSADPGILLPLQNSNGVIFPYTPQISTSYKANYSNYDLTHSNYRGYFYQNSYTDAITITAAFTAQDSKEADYLLAVIHFFRSVTKMFYGQSPNLGSPPPICYLNGLGEFQFNKHPVLVTQFNYTLPNSVDYIRAGSSNNLQLNQTQLRSKTNTANPALTSVNRLATALLTKGAAQTPRPPPKLPIKNNPTYVPTKMDIVITLLPAQSRTQVSQQFNLQSFANGNQLRGGFW